MSGFGQDELGAEAAARFRHFWGRGRMAPAGEGRKHASARLRETDSQPSDLILIFSDPLERIQGAAAQHPREVPARARRPLFFARHRGRLPAAEPKESSLPALPKCGSRLC